MNHKLPILYSFRRCPYAIRARMGLAVAGLNYWLRETDLKDKSSSLLEYSPKGTVPVLVLPNNQIIDENSECLPLTTRGITRLKIERKWLNFGSEIFRVAGIYGYKRSPFEKLPDKKTYVIDKENHVFNRIHIDDLVEIIIKDNGPGVSPEIKDQIFFPMISGKENGSGIGLSISQDIVRIHGGSISFYRKDEQTIFSILVPISTTIQGAQIA